ncbi:unnamed protein product [Vicia faba]|uniref:Amino acid transporter transmembrane domain-containing protein n=1 Tax=Vicia faba TaxID=3906 RepID=A0AAV0ZJV5_VICFA|nr:unnamed protein product [Vicia faba]CAI8598058.1 unnamed protein product [Vicia faba]
MMKSLRKILSLRSNYCIKQRSEHGENSVALPVQLPNCNDCDHIVVEDRKNSTTTEGAHVEPKHDANADSSFVHAVINMVGMLIGLGQLSTPYAVEKGGWASALLLIGLGVICAYTSYILGKCLEKNPTLTSYVDIGNQAFGTKGRYLVATFIYMEIFMALVSYTISLHDNLITVFIGTHLKMKFVTLTTPQILTLVAILIALPSLWIRDMSSISFLSTGGIVMSLLIFVCVAATAIFGGGEGSNNHSIPVFKLHNIPSISGIYVFGLGGHIVFPDLYKSMKDPSKFTKVSIVSFTIVTAVYTSMGFMGAKMYGNDVQSQITLSLPPNKIITKIALWATVLTPMTKYALEFAPFAIHLEHALPNSLNARTKLVIRGCVASVLLLIILALALSVPYFEHVLSLTGSLVSVAICLVFPSIFYLKIFWGKITRFLLVLNISLVIFGFLLAGMGTISSTKLIWQTFISHHST